MQQGADFFAKKAAERAEQCTEEENLRRQQNGRQSNVAYTFEEEEAEVFFRGTQNAGDESRQQPSAFGLAAFGYA